MSNFQPYVVAYDADLKTSTVLDRLHRGIVVLRGRYPNVDWSSAVACPDDAPRVTAHADAIRLYFEDANRREIEMRLRPLFTKCPALRDVVKRRIDGASQPRPVSDRRSEAERVFG